ncbi:MAG: hypothetical protein LBK42_10095 [Propionibacteriaceae bacterium]|jgi:hypothetical protein|nr:hypothetical protein [Propionibacteriaceae bacterium]
MLFYWVALVCALGGAVAAVFLGLDNDYLLGSDNGAWYWICWLFVAFTGLGGVTLFQIFDERRRQRAGYRYQALSHGKSWFGLTIVAVVLCIGVTAWVVGLWAGRHLGLPWGRP